MGNASTMETSKTVFLDINGKSEKIMFSRYSCSRDIHELICQVANVNKASEIALRDEEGAHIHVSPMMSVNTLQTPYKVHLKEPTRNHEEDLCTQMLSQVAEQFTRVFKVEEVKADITNRITALERRLETEGLKVVEIDKCKRDITDIKDQIWNAQKKFVDLNRMSSLSDENKISLKGDVPTYPKYTLSDETINYLKQPTFDIWHWEPNEMLSLLEHMYHELGLVKEFNTNPITLKRWLLCVQENYRNNPFHNFRHCFCVTQMMYGMIHLCKLWDKMSREDLGILMTAAVCHDLDHPGYNNTYQINARTELAIRYNDISPLENHHCAVAFKILSNPECNIFSNVDKDAFKRIRSEITTLILATDMANHGDILDNFKAKIDQSFDYCNKDHLNTEIIKLILATDMARHNQILGDFNEKLPNFDFKTEDHRHSLKMLLIKCCDISNEVRPMEVSEPWVDCLLEEYFNQSDREKSEGLPVAPFMDREKVTKPSAQIGFIKFVLIPMFETVSKLCTGLNEDMVIPPLGSNTTNEQMQTSEEKNKLELYFQIDKCMCEPLRQARDRYEDLKASEQKLHNSQP